MGWPLLARCMVVGACLAGCAAIAGINDGSDSPDAPDDSGFGVRMTGDAEGGVGPDGAPCFPNSAELQTGPVHAKRALAPPTLDGVFDEWACVDRIDVGKGAGESQMPAGAQSVEFAFQWTPSDVYFYAHAVTTQPGLDNGGDQIFRNDSVHVFIGRDPTNVGSPTYRMGDHQIAIDYGGHVGDYVNGSFTTSKTEARVKVTDVGGGALDFQIEARIPVGSLGFPATTILTTAQKLVVNLMLVDGKTAGTPGSYGFRVWRLPPIAQCPCVTGCCDRFNGTQNIPTCDFRCTNSMVLDD